ncbi:uncharacterized protein LOC100898123 [Galendromus occidentalis]|uniref:Uncharacterized protein LOC100898123 n=1 Tax=Galendromus occidentalis TaxID=34638 RepID=A0AAJ6QT75_9ACAR|nr:uncharacterized protein LOC100898123 [Galendromus occidentalis]
MDEKPSTSKSGDDFTFRRPLTPDEILLPITAIGKSDDGKNVPLSSLPEDIDPVVRHILSLQKYFDDVSQTLQESSEGEEGEWVHPRVPEEPVSRNCTLPGRGRKISDDLLWELGQNCVKVIAQMVGFSSAEVDALKMLVGAMFGLMSEICHQWRVRMDSTDREECPGEDEALNLALMTAGFPDGIGSVLSHVNWVRRERQRWLGKCIAMASGKRNPHGDKTSESSGAASASDPSSEKEQFSASGSAMEFESSRTSSKSPSAMDIGSGRSSAMDTAPPSPSDSAFHLPDQTQASGQSSADGREYLAR